METKNCAFFGSARGCKYGKSCKWSHTHPESIPTCPKYHTNRKKSFCRAGNKCKFRHLSVGQKKEERRRLSKQKHFKIKHKKQTVKQKQVIQFIHRSKLGTNDTESLLLFGYIQTIYGNQENIEINIPIDIINLCLTYTIDGSLIIGTKQCKVLQSDYVYMFTDIVLEKGSKLTVNAWNSTKRSGGKLLIKCFNSVILKEGASINLSGKGYKGSVEGYGEGKGGGSDGAGASYGTKGQIGHKNSKMTGTIGNIYGDKELSKLELGSGGGGQGKNKKGGSGGGALKLECNLLKLEKKACIECNGKDNVMNSRGFSGFGGCGSGGSVYIICNEIKMANSSHISVRGGIHPDNSCANGGNGRMRIDCKKKHKNISNNNFQPAPMWGKW